MKMDQDDLCLPAPEVRRRYGRSDMWLWRMLQDENSGFPKPLVINNRRYWRLADLRDWELSQAAKQGSRSAHDSSTSPRA
jgi:predicted DNA-binding transcriptional regulator AlpA